MKQRERVRWLDGPTFARWLEDQGITPRMVEYEGSTMAKWRGGRHVKEATADEILVGLGFHLSELPDDAWVHGPIRRKWDDDVKRKCLADYEKGISAKNLQDRYGPPRDTISRWASKAGIRR